MTAPQDAASAAPLADLYARHTGKRRGIHFGSPDWADAYGSRVAGGMTVRHESPDDSGEDAPWLLVSVSQRYGINGAFSNVTLIQRVLADSGAALPSYGANSGATLKCTVHGASHLFDEESSWGPKRPCISFRHKFTDSKVVIKE